jgi:hypothetical protein
MAFQLNCKEPGPVQGEESQEKEGLVCPCEQSPLMVRRK